MRVNRSSSSNLKFLYGSVFFFAMLVLTMVLFTYYAMREASKRVESQIFSYTISFAGNIEGTACDIIFDDSLIYSSPSIVSSEQVVVNRRMLRDTVIVEGEILIRERTLFSPEASLKAINQASGDTLTIIPGQNSKISLSLFKGKISAWLAE